MDPGSRSQPLSAAGEVPWTRAALVWMLMILLETGNGYVREVFVAPETGALRAKQLGLLIGATMVLLVAWACSRWLRADTLRKQLIVGAFWVALTLVFEFALGRAMGTSWAKLLADYNPLRGGFMLFGLLVMFAAPWLTRRNR
jgi:hypothetical protein